MRAIIIAVLSSVGAFATCLMCDAPTQDYVIHYALWLLIISQEYDRKEGTK